MLGIKPRSDGLVNKIMAETMSQTAYVLLLQLEHIQRKIKKKNKKLPGTIETVDIAQW